MSEERFTRIDSVENDGKNIYGHLHTGEWGDFEVCFKFHLTEQRKIYRLDIGQA